MGNQTIEILYLDDEVENLVGFKASFRKYYKIHTASTIHSAIEILNDNEIHIIVIDQKMPLINGTDFLQLINEDFPDLMRVILTGYVNHDDALVDIMGKANVYRCISKPWSENDIRITMEDAFRIYCFKKQKRMEVDFLKNELSSNIKTPIENLEGLLRLAQSHMNDENALSDDLKNMNAIIDQLKVDLKELSS